MARETEAGPACTGRGASTQHTKAEGGDRGWPRGASTLRDSLCESDAFALRALQRTMDDAEAAGDREDRRLHEKLIGVHGAGARGVLGALLVCLVRAYEPLVLLCPVTCVS